MSDIKLPPIRTLDGFDEHLSGGPSSRLPPLDSQRSISSTPGRPGTSAPNSGSLRHAQASDMRTVASPSTSASASTSRHRGDEAYASRASEYERGYHPDVAPRGSAHTSPNNRPVRGDIGWPAPTSRPEETHSRVEGSTSTFRHPFFDGGDKDMAPLSQPPTERVSGRENWRTILLGASHNLSLAHTMIRHCLAGGDDSDLTPMPREAVMGAQTFALNALNVLKDLLDDYPDPVPVSGGLPSNTRPSTPRHPSDQSLRGGQPSPRAWEQGHHSHGRPWERERPLSDSAAEHVGAAASSSGAHVMRAVSRGGTHDVAPPHLSYCKPAPSRSSTSIFGLNKETASPASAPVLASRPVTDRPPLLPSTTADRSWSPRKHLAYEGQDPDMHDSRPRPPGPVYRVHQEPGPSWPSEGAPSAYGPAYQRPPPLHQDEASSYPSSHHQREQREREKERDQHEQESSYMYAPPSIRARLAARQKSSSVAALSASPVRQEHSAPGYDGYYPDHGPARRVDVGVAPGPPMGGSKLFLQHPAPMASPSTGPSYMHASGGVGPAMHPGSRPAGPYGHSDEEEYRRSSDGGNNGGTKYKKRSRAPAPSSCLNCNTRETPEWRRGPDGARTLCNACGLHFAKMQKKGAGTFPEGSASGDGGSPQEAMAAMSAPAPAPSAIHGQSHGHPDPPMPSSSSSKYY